MVVKVKLALAVPKVEAVDKFKNIKLLTVTLLFVRATAGLAPWVKYNTPLASVNVVGVVLAKVVFTEIELAVAPALGVLMAVALRKF